MEHQPEYKDMHIPQPPTADGMWQDKRRDHDSFQKIVSLAAQIGGISASVGCLTLSAERARQEAEAHYWDSQMIEFRMINTKIEPKKF